MRALLEGVIGSFYSRSFYADLANRWRGIGMGFILIATFIDVICIGVASYPAVHRLMAQIPVIADKLPSVTVKGGKMSIDKPVPYFIEFGPTGHSMWIEADTNYDVKDIDTLSKAMKQNNIVLLFTADKIIVNKKTSNELQIYNVSDGFKTDRIITREDWRALAQKIQNRLPPVMLVTLSVLSFLVNIAGVFIAAILVMLLSLTLRLQLDFAGAMRLAAAASIPSDVICAVPLLLHGQALHGLLAWVIWGAYLVFAAVACRPDRGLEPG